jgi:hypothetical protein
MIEAKFDDFRCLNQNTIDLPIVKEIICNFWVQNVANIMWGKQISLDSLDINQFFKLPTQGIAILAQETYNQEWSEYFEGRKEEHHK